MASGWEIVGMIISGLAGPVVFVWMLTRAASHGDKSMSENDEQAGDQVDDHEPGDKSLAAAAALGRQLGAIDAMRRRWAVGAVVSAIIIGLVAIADLFWESRQLLVLAQKSKAIELHLGMAIAGKAVTLAVLFTSAFALLRAGERLVMPLKAYLDYVKASKRVPDKDDIVSDVLKQLNAYNKKPD